MALDADLNEDKDFLPFKTRLRGGLAALLDEDPDHEFPPEEQLEFFEAILEDRGPIETGLSMGWSMAQIDRFLKHPERAAIMDMLQEAEYESMERAIKQGVRQLNSTCIKLYAFCKMGHRGWVDRKEVSVTGQTQHEIVISVREGLESKMRELVTGGGSDAVASLQAAMLDSEIVDAELVE
jgi:hypothetical protein